MGYKAFVVAVDREACVLYKQALDRYLPPEYSDVIISHGHNDGPDLRRFHYDDTREGEIRKAFRNREGIDFAKLGVLYLRRGNWRGRQLVPRSWVRTSTSPAPAASDYGYWWWLEPHGPFLARGNLGQFVFVDSRHEVVIVRFGTGDGGVDWPSVFAELADELPDPRPGAEGARRGDSSQLWLRRHDEYGLGETR